MNGRRHPAPEYMTVLRSLVLQDSRAMRAYARTGLTVTHPQGSAPLMDEALVICRCNNRARSWRALSL